MAGLTIAVLAAVALTPSGAGQTVTAITGSQTVLVAGVDTFDQFNAPGFFQVTWVAEKANGATLSWSVSTDQAFTSCVWAVNAGAPSCSGPVPVPASPNTEPLITVSLSGPLTTWGEITWIH